VSGPGQRRRSPWLRSQSEGFRPIKQVGVAGSIGFPLLIVGVLLLIIAFGADSSMFWWLGGGLTLAGLITAASGRII
jgi:hypothetical protein